MIVVDWGTTNLRVFVCADDGTILKSVQNDQGIKAVPKGGFGTALTQALKELGEHNNLPVFVCGMAGARGRWLEAPYCTTPISLTDIEKKLSLLPENFGGYLVPGARTLSPAGMSDVMRGEEIQVFGGLSHFGIQSGILCLPGTHSKWVQVHDNQIVDFATFMTGDIHQALSHTILGSTDAPHCPEAYGLGLDMSVNGDCGLLHQLFTARMRMLGGELVADQIPSYVSGLLIGHELAETASLRDSNKPVMLIGAETLCHRYQDAFNYFDISCITLESSSAICTGVAALRALQQGEQ